MRYTYLRLETDVALPDSTNVAIPWSTAHHDDFGMWNSVQPTRITIPKGISKVRFSCGSVFETNTAGMRQVFLQKNSEEHPLGYISHTQHGGYSNESSTSWTDQGGIMDCKQGDFFKLIAVQTSGGSINFLGVNSSWFLCEVIS